MDSKLILIILVFAILFIIGKCVCLLVLRSAISSNVCRKQTSKYETDTEEQQITIETDIINKNRIELRNTQLALTATLGNINHNDVFYPFIPMRSKIPISKTVAFQISQDNKVSCSFDIRYGENKIGSSNTQIGTFCVTDIPPLPKGEVKLITTFYIDEFSILTVLVEVPKTGNVTINKFDIRNIVNEPENSHEITDK